jgi:two-component sensor histidine kinase
MDPDYFAMPLEGEPQFQQLADFVPQLMWLAKPDGWIYWYNKKCYDYTGANPEEVAGWGWQTVIEPHALPELMEGWSRSIATGEPFEMVFPIKAALRWFGTNTDISEQKHAEEHLQLLLNELNHRVKNTLATVQAIASQSMRTIPREYFEAFSDRLVALSRAHDLLMQSNWKAADLREIIGQSLAPFYATGLDGRLTMEGPSVRIPARNAASWSMAIHELCMNAFKHGAFSADAGRVRIVWNAPEEKWLRFYWIENGGPPVTMPKHRGFGTRLIESLGRELAGTANIRFEPGGLTCVIDAVLPPAPDR